MFFFFSSRRRHTIFDCDWSSDVCSSDLELLREPQGGLDVAPPVGIGDERHPSVEHRQQGVQVPRRRRQRLHLRAAEIGLAPLVLERVAEHAAQPFRHGGDRKSTRLNSSHSQISYAVFCLKKKTRSS